MNNGILKICKAKLNQEYDYTTIINYLFTLDIEEQEIIGYFEALDVPKEIIKDLLIYKFGLDPELIGAM